MCNFEWNIQISTFSLSLFFSFSAFLFFFLRFLLFDWRDEILCRFLIDHCFVLTNPLILTSKCVLNLSNKKMERRKKRNFVEWKRKKNSSLALKFEQNGKNDDDYYYNIGRCVLHVAVDIELNDINISRERERRKKLWRDNKSWTSWQIETSDAPKHKSQWQF